MKKLLLIVFVLFSLQSFAQQTYVPDDSFEAYLEANGMGNGIPNDDYVTTANINGEIGVNVVGQSINNLTGIEDFTALKYLHCNNNLLTSLDLSQNTALIVLNCGDNQLTNLDLSQNTELAEFYCYYNQLMSLNVSQNTLLTILGCDNNMITSLDISQNTALTELVCANNPLSTLDVSQNELLAYLGCGNNLLSALDLTQNANLHSLHIDNNQLTNIDLTQNILIETFTCSSNQLTFLDVAQNTLMKNLNCESNQIESIDVSLNTELVHLNCQANNPLSCLNVKNGNNYFMTSNPGMQYGGLFANNNPNLFCIDVDDVSWSNAAWTDIDAQTSFSENCNNDCSVGVHELASESKEVIKIVDVIGRETTAQKNRVLIYVYSDGATERIFEFE